MLCIVLTGCGSNGTKASGNSEDNPIKIGFSALPTWYIWRLVEEKGFFEKHDVNVKLTYFSVYGDSVSALNSGEIDANSQTLLDTIAPISHGIDLKAIFVTDNSDGGDGIVAKKGIDSVEDLRNQDVGTEIGTIAHFFLLTVLQDHDMTEDDVNFTNMSVQDAGTSFIAGKLDAAELWEPFLSKSVQNGNGEKLVTSADYPGLIADFVVIRKEITKKRPDDVQKIMAAWFDGIHYLKDHQKNLLKLLLTLQELAKIT